MNFNGSVVPFLLPDSKATQCEGPADLHQHLVPSTELSQQELMSTGDSLHLESSLSSHVSARPRASSEIEALRSLRPPER